MTLTAIRVPSWVHAKAVTVMEKYKNGQLHARMHYQHGRLSLKVTHRWRLLSRNNGRDWVIISHERYNRMKDGA